MKIIREHERYHCWSFEVGSTLSGEPYWGYFPEYLEEVDQHRLTPKAKKLVLELLTISGLNSVTVEPHKVTIWVHYRDDLTDSQAEQARKIITAA